MKAMLGIVFASCNLSISRAFVSPQRHFAQLPSLQFLHHGRRKQKRGYKRYVAKLRAESSIGVHDGSIDASNDVGSVHPEDKRRNRTRFRARVAYCGTPFHGWQLQPGRSTIQGEIEAAFQRRFHRRIPVVGAGRTDSGVHARGQAIHFDLNPDEIPFAPPLPPATQGEEGTIMSDDDRIKSDQFCKDLEHSMNRMMELDIRLFRLEVAPYTWTAQSTDHDDSDQDEEGEIADASNDTTLHPRPWHVIQRAKSKWYSYRLAFGPTLWNPMERFTRTHFVHRPSFASQSDSEGPYAITEEDMERLQNILKLYEGTHDFAAFGGQLEQNAKKRNGGEPMKTIRTVYKVELVKEPIYSFGKPSSDQRHGFIGQEGNYRIDFLLQGALYKMVRNMVGTAVEVWLGRMTEETLIDLLRIEEDGKSGRWDNPCKPAPPEGLTLECVYYNDGF